MKKRIITIAREYGSGGRGIAQKLAEELGLVYYDNEVIHLAALELGVDVSVVMEVAETKSSPFMYNTGSFHMDLPMNDKVYGAQAKIIRHLAKYDQCIIVNQCADAFLQGREDVIRVFIHAPLESRIQRVQEEYGEDQEDIKKYIQKKDKQRASYYNYYTEQRWGNVSSYDITLNSDMGFDNVIKAIRGIFDNKD
ncbi:cytidylate kinase-like family protein [Tannockella kyphosi]|uniref:cytidylate kinase-like family protein n=1 Tax=Tannockella kyphosi TaxID=2899121 RepID=UPI002013A1DF|nr:cytidylate kinase-like family protein [Tannockella kyphosi]